MSHLHLEVNQEWEATRALEPSVPLPPPFRRDDPLYPLPQLIPHGYIAPQDRRSALIVEDNPLLRELYRALLEMEGFAATEVSNGVEALLWLQEQTADVILLDLEMPVMDGRSFLEYRLQQHHIRRLPVLVLSGRVDNAELCRALRRLGADQMLRKPVRREELVGAVRALLAIPPIPDLPRPVEARQEGGRRDARVAFTVPVLVHTSSSGDLSGHLMDLSASGLGVTLPHRLNETETITVRLEMDGCALVLEGVVRWAGVGDAGMGYRHGARFTHRQEELFPLYAYSFFSTRPQGRGSPLGVNNLGNGKLRPRAAQGGFYPFENRYSPGLPLPPRTLPEPPFQFSSP